MGTEVASVRSADFTGTARHDSGVIRVALAGHAEAAALAAVEQLLGRTHAEAHRLGAGEVIVDLTQLATLSAVCFKAFVDWLTDLQEQGEAARYRVTFRSNPRLAWQKRSLHSLRCVAVDLITVVEG